MSRKYTNLLNDCLSRAVKEGKLRLEEGPDEQKLAELTNKLNDKTHRSFLKACLVMMAFDHLYLKKAKPLRLYRLPILFLTPFVMTSILSRKEILDLDAQELIVVYKYERQLISIYPELMAKRTHYADLPPVAQPALHQLQNSRDFKSTKETGSSQSGFSLDLQPSFPESPAVKSVPTGTLSQSPSFNSMPSPAPIANSSIPAPDSNTATGNDYSNVNWDPYGFYTQNNIYKRFS
jgi:hypothetical protein